MFNGTEGCRLFAAILTTNRRHIAKKQQGGDIDRFPSKSASFGLSSAADAGYPAH
jgi:hypothetical protein